MDSVKIDENGVQIILGDKILDVNIENENVVAEEVATSNKAKAEEPQKNTPTDENQKPKTKPKVRKKKVVITNDNNEEGEGLRKRLATEKHPTIEAILNDLFRFETQQQAEDRVNAIKDYFIISKKLPKDKDEKDIIKLWIRGYGITPDEEKKGYLGNYAAFRIVELKKDNRFTIRAEKQPIALKYHPQRMRPKRKHPDWGHPALRLVKKQVSFETIEDANKILAQIHAEYPDISIPSVNKLFVIIYSKAENPEKPVQKYILEVKPSRDGGGFYVDYKLNDYKKNNLPAKDKKSEAGASDDSSGAKKSEAAGYFTSMVSLKRDKKSKIDVLRKKKKEEESTS